MREAAKTDFAPRDSAIWHTWRAICMKSEPTKFSEFVIRVKPAKGAVRGVHDEDDWRDSQNGWTAIFRDTCNRRNATVVNQQVLSGNWNELKGKLKQKWGKLTDDDVRSFNGNVDQLVGRIQQKTGESRDAIEEFLSQFSEKESEFLSGVRDKIEETAEQAMETARDGYDALREGYAEAERVVKERPRQVIALAFGLGLLSGLGVALYLRDRSHESRLSHGRETGEHVGRQILNALGAMVPDSVARKYQS